MALSHPIQFTGTSYGIKHHLNMKYLHNPGFCHYKVPEIKLVLIIFRLKSIKRPLSQRAGQKDCLAAKTGAEVYYSTQEKRPMKQSGCSELSTSMFSFFPFFSCFILPFLAAY